MNRAAQVLDDPDHPPDRTADHLPCILGVEPFTDRRRADEVGEQRGDNPAFLATVLDVDEQRRPTGCAEPRSVRIFCLTVRADCHEASVRRADRPSPGTPLGTTLF